MIMNKPTVTGTLNHGATLGDETHMDFEMRPVTTGDMFDAEVLSSVERPLEYQGALISLQLIRLGSLEGPVPFAVIRALHPEDFELLIEAQKETESLGEAIQHG